MFPDNDASDSPLNFNDPGSSFLACSHIADILNRFERELKIPGSYPHLVGFDHYKGSKLSWVVAEVNAPTSTTPFQDSEQQNIYSHLEQLINEFQLLEEDYIMGMST